MAEYIVEKKQTSGGWTWAEPKGKLIRCKDCKHYRNNKCDQLSLLLFLLGNEEDDYCSHAEREEE